MAASHHPPDLNRFSLQGRCALITGASRGIGRALAVALAEAGADTVLAGRHRNTLEAVAESIEALGRRCHIATLDVASKDSIDTFFAQLANTDCRPDILINNAGVEEVCDSLEVDEALWNRIADTNLKGAFFVAQGFARAWLAKPNIGHPTSGNDSTGHSTSGAQASIVNLGSLGSAVGIPTAAPYTASKSALLGLTRTLATEWAAKGIRVNSLGPGYFRTQLTDVFYQDDAWQQQMLGKIPLQRFGDLDDLAGMTIFLASTAASYVTGQIFYVDGGCLAAL